MRERIKIFTFVTGHGETVVDDPCEERIGRWLADNGGELVSVSQSESERPGGGHHVTICLWYLPEEDAPCSPAAR